MESPEFRRTYGLSSTAGTQSVATAVLIQDIHDEYHGQLPRAEVGNRHRPVREHARRANGYLPSRQDDLTQDVMSGINYRAGHLREDENGDNCERTVAAFSQQTDPPPTHEQDFESLSAASRTSSTPPLDSLPSLIRIANCGSKCAPKPTLTPTLLAKVARQLVRKSFDISVCLPADVEEERAVGAKCILGHDGHRQQWSGVVWGNFCGVRFYNHHKLDQYIEAAIDKFNRREFDCGVFVINRALGSRFFRSLLEYPHCILFRPVATLPPAAEDQDEGDMYLMCEVIVTYFGRDTSLFANLFSEYGSVPGMSTWCYV